MTGMQITGRVCLDRCEPRRRERHPQCKCAATSSQRDQTQSASSLTSRSKGLSLQPRRRRRFPLDAPQGMRAGARTFATTVKGFVETIAPAIFAERKSPPRAAASRLPLPRAEDRPAKAANRSPKALDRSARVVVPTASPAALGDQGRSLMADRTVSKGKPSAKNDGIWRPR
jgi:hypothetical protein